MLLWRVDIFLVGRCGADKKKEPETASPLSLATRPPKKKKDADKNALISKLSPMGPLMCAARGDHGGSDSFCGVLKEKPQ